MQPDAPSLLWVGRLGTRLTLLCAVILLRIRRDGDTCKRPIARAFGHFSYRALVSNASGSCKCTFALKKLCADIIIVPFAGAVLMLERPFFDGG